MVFYNIKKTNICIFFDKKISEGGNYQQALNNIILASKLNSKKIDVKVVTTIYENLKVLRQLNIKCFFYSSNILSRIFLVIQSYLPEEMYRFIRLFNKKNNFETFLNKLNIDLVYFPSQSTYVNYLHGINFIYTVFDLAHLDYPEFPEVRADKIFEKRERNFKKNLPRAIAVLVDSEFSKKKLISKYNLSENRIYVFPFSSGNKIFNKKDKNQPPKKINIKKKYSLNLEYIFYPAQFWAHKNHIYILNALKILKEEKKISIGAIFSGSDMGNLNYIKSMTKKFGLQENVRFVGFVSSEEIREIYKQSLSLVMPTYFGPTNIPPLEAFEHNVPVMYSNLPGLRDQVGKAALLLDLNNPMSLVFSIKKLLKSKKLRKFLITQGKLRLKKLSSDKKKLYVLNKIITNFKTIRDKWQQ